MPMQALKEEEVPGRKEGKETLRSRAADEMRAPGSYRDQRDDVIMELLLGTVSAAKY